MNDNVTYFSRDNTHEEYNSTFVSRIEAYKTKLLYSLFDIKYIKINTNATLFYETIINFLYNKNDKNDTVTFLLL